MQTHRNWTSGHLSLAAPLTGTWCPILIAQIPPSVRHRWDEPSGFIMTSALRQRVGMFSFVVSHLHAQFVVTWRWLNVFSRVAMFWDWVWTRPPTQSPGAHSLADRCSIRMAASSISLHFPAGIAHENSSSSGCGSGTAPDSEDSQTGAGLTPFTGQDIKGHDSQRRRPPRQKINARERYRTLR